MGNDVVGMIDGCILQCPEKECTAGGVVKRVAVGVRVTVSIPSVTGKSILTHYLVSKKNSR
ncbi:hypothetical protein SDC9_170554 [bioreactor metagenome]|uniref:Uncharacterized protein n=1 Tax=bioreactor metagenome TaxID=1076179 RepID=A0A645GAL1_9ZZZZ